MQDLLHRIGRETVNIIEQDIVGQGLVKTGKLKKSIKYDVVRSGDSYSIVFEQIYYGYFLDQGTRQISARDFFQKHIDQQLDEYAFEIGEAYLEDKLDDELKDKNI